jgi:hypothetical protein
MNSLHSGEVNGGEDATAKGSEQQIAFKKKHETLHLALDPSTLIGGFRADNRVHNPNDNR